MRLPVEVRFSENVPHVHVRIAGKDRILSPVNGSCDSFFLADERPSEGFMEKRPDQKLSERGPF
ncbi:MAG: AbrB/MazE/SpoVT family DNA-binding domain-containing protein [Gammaproteobacteria bacterium]|nr:AbrB/MazE/SpoVT family DNA-binding domain-containing protein [Gammaproteobacteria bacterium]